MSGSGLYIEPVSNRRELKAFVKFPYRLYRSDSYWVPPLISERMAHFDPGRNPFYEHAQVQLFRAVEGGETVGTIAAIADELHPQVWNEPVGFFGEFEAINDQRVADRLFLAAREWLAARGREVMRGPLNMNINEEVGLLIDGFDGRPVIMMTYNPRYYATLIENHGFVKAKDLYAYKVALARFGRDLEKIPSRVTRVARIAQERYHVRIRQADLSELDREVELIKPIYRQAWSRNWGAIPMTDAEFDHLVENLRPILDPEMTYLAFIDNEVVGCFVALPDFCQAIYNINGRLFPFGWIKFLLNKRKINGIRVLIMGVLEEHRLKGIESLFYQQACRASVRKGYEWGEMSWILEDNYRVSRGIEAMGGRVYRTYRIYDIPTRNAAGS